MAESSLSVGFPELIGLTGEFLRYGYKAYASYTAAQQALLNRLVNAGVRRVYYPQALDAEFSGYEWSWLRPTTTISLYGSYSTGTVTIADGVVTLVTGTFPSWAASGYISIGDENYEVATRDGDNQVTLTDTTLDAAAGTSYVLYHDFNYDLPDDFGRLSGCFYYSPEDFRQSIGVISVGQLLEERATSNLTGYPIFAATRYKTTTGATGQRQEVLFYPTPDIALTLNYEYEAYSGVISASYPYPLGGMQMAEVYTESCLAMAEARVLDEEGIHTKQFKELLVDAIKRDRRRGARNFGAMGQPCNGTQEEFRRSLTGSVYPITYKGDYL